MKLLAFDTSADACTVVLSVNGKEYSQQRIAPRQQARLLLPMIDHLLHEANLTVAQLDAVAFVQGPGSFTGLRIAAGVAQGIAYSHDLPVVGLSSLQALAEHCRSERADCRDVLVCCDARMNEWYWAHYRLDDAQQIMLGEDKLSTLESLFAIDKPSYLLLGAGAQTEIIQQPIMQHFNLTARQVLTQCYVQPRVLAKLALAGLVANKQVAASEALPVYLRQQVVQ